MANYLATFGGTEQGENRHNTSYGIHRDYTSEAMRLFSSLRPEYNISKAFLFDNDWLKRQPEYVNNRVFQEASFGWAFKPLAIHVALQSVMENGDNLLWADSNHIIRQNPQPLIDYAEQNHIYCHDHRPTYYANCCWTHKDIFVRMNCDSEPYWMAGQVQVNVMCFHKDEFTLNFVKEWKEYACDYDTMIGHTLPNHPCFVDHRHEQSIFTILATKYGVIPQLNPIHIIDEMMGINI